MSSREVNQYIDLLNETIRQLDATIYDIEDYTFTPRSRTDDFHDLKFDAIPILRKLKDARAYANQSVAHYGSPKKSR